MEKIIKLSKHKNWGKYKEVLDKFYDKRDEDGKRMDTSIAIGDTDMDILSELIEAEAISIKSANPLKVTGDDRIEIKLRPKNYREYRVYEELGSEYPIELIEDRCWIKMDSHWNGYADDRSLVRHPIDETIEMVKDWYEFANKTEKEFHIKACGHYPRHNHRLEEAPYVVKEYNEEYDFRYAMFKVDKGTKNAGEKLNRLFASVEEDFFSFTEKSEGVYLFYSAAEDDRPNEYYLDDVSNLAGRMKKEADEMLQVVDSF